MDATDPLSRHLREELAQMHTAWPLLLEATPAPPAWSWEDLREALLELTSTPVEEFVIRGALSAVLKQARFLPPDRLLWELLRLAAATRDHGFRSSAREMLEVEMP